MSGIASVTQLQLSAIFGYCNVKHLMSHCTDFTSIVKYLQLCNQMDEFQPVIILIRSMIDFLVLLYDITEDYNSHKYNEFVNSIESIPVFNESSFDDASDALKRFTYQTTNPDMIPLTSYAAGMIKYWNKDRKGFKKIIDDLNGIFVMSE